MTNEDRRGDLSTAAEHIEQIWKDVLKVREIPTDATFFELRGQSISAVRIAARIEDELGVQIDMGDLFEDPDLATFTRDVVAKLAGSAIPDSRTA
ncbi:phosphopantetheine-binding protein [Amycolatopsis sp.]|jgi:acyl carrier protein|uniref:phosphopantetheine-binding protein n=1 Tax=Amycolatopsis sp. TaxID=37632 RepID=UPI002E03D835|nr:phosphopantetheine-binding protein [Amycolatopsis sp.]